ncbi:MAG: PAS domain-containing sensor histidine kinase [Anaerolineae bacterium]|nr:PAS domain-containing sensor histidine kinase [Anaerolineae bacterium]
MDELNTSDAEEREALFQRIEKRLLHQGYWEGEATFKRKDGRTFDAAIIRSDARDSTGKRQGIVTVLRDISQEKELAEQKARFIASASHELRTPIANIKTRLFLMKRRPEQFMEHINIAESVASLMQKLVEDMFDISRFERGIIVINPEDVVLQDLLTQVVAYQEPEAERRQITIKIDLPSEPLHLQVDPYRLSQVMINLLKNALSYTSTEGIIQVRAVMDENNVVIQVIDNGAGISQEALPQLFQPFFRISEDNKGAGLGLSISQEIVKAHGGIIEVDSTVGKGSSFTIRLPLHQGLETNEVGR